MQRVTIFGGSGFVGRYIVRRLAEAGHLVQVVCRDTEKAKSLKPMGAVGQITAVNVDLRDEKAVEAVVQASDVVIYLIGILFQKGRQKFDFLHHQAPAMVAKLCKKHQVKRFVYMSAIGADVNAKSQYAKTKGLGEQAVLKAYNEATILRPSVIFGAEDNVFNLFARLSRISPVLPLVGGGKTRFQPVYVDDIAKAVMASLANSKTKGQTFELGGPAVMSFKELMLLMLQTIRRRRHFISLPFWLAHFKAWFWEFLPRPILTRDQVKLLRQDNIVDRSAKTFLDLHIQPTAMEAVLPSYLEVYRPGGQWDYARDYAKDIKTD